MNSLETGNIIGKDCSRKSIIKPKGNLNQKLNLKIFQRDVSWLYERIRSLYYIKFTFHVIQLLLNSDIQFFKISSTNSLVNNSDYFNGISKCVLLCVRLFHTIVICSWFMICYISTSLLLFDFIIFNFIMVNFLFRSSSNLYHICPTLPRVYSNVFYFLKNVCMSKTLSVDSIFRCF